MILNKYRRMFGMNKEERLQIIQSIDKKILGSVNNVLIDLENLADLSEYKIHINNRKKSINILFQDFDMITFKVDRKKLLFPNKKRNVVESNYQHQLDKVIKTKISNKLEEYYQMIYISKITNQSHILMQLIDRKIRLEELFDDYNLYSEYLDYKEIEL